MKIASVFGHQYAFSRRCDACQVTWSTILRTPSRDDPAQPGFPWWTADGQCQFVPFIDHSQVSMPSPA